MWASLFLLFLPLASSVAMCCVKLYFLIINTLYYFWNFFSIHQRWWCMERSKTLYTSVKVMQSKQVLTLTIIVFLCYILCIRESFSFASLLLHQIKGKQKEMENQKIFSNQMRMLLITIIQNGTKRANSLSFSNFLNTWMLSSMHT